MRTKVLCAVLVLVVLFTVAVEAYDVPGTTVVYVTNTGTKYHRQGCTYLESAKAMTISNAEKSGYTPCSRCRPDVLTGKYESAWEGDSELGTRSNASEQTPATETKNDNSKWKDVIGAIAGLAYIAAVIAAECADGFTRNRYRRWR